MINYEHAVEAYYRGRNEGIAEMEKEVVKARQESYEKGFRDGQEHQADNVRRVLVD